MDIGLGFFIYFCINLLLQQLPASRQSQEQDIMVMSAIQFHNKRKKKIIKEQKKKKKDDVAICDKDLPYKRVQILPLQAYYQD